MPAPHAHDQHQSHGGGVRDGAAATAVLEVGGLHWASEKAVVEATLRRLAGVSGVDANAAAPGAAGLPG